MCNKDWRKWCRLCGEENGSKVDITIKMENHDTLSVSVVKYFGIKISENINKTAKVCLVCYDIIDSIINYNARIEKVNCMFLELENYYQTHEQNQDLKFLREKYKLVDQEDKVTGLEIGNHNLHKRNLLKFKSVCVVDETVDNRNEVTEEEFSESAISLNEKNDVNIFEKETTPASENDSNYDLSEVEEKKFECPKCGKCFKFKRYVGEHIRRVHKKDRRYICDVCKMEYETKKDLTDHFSTHKEERKYKCSICEKDFKKKQDLRIHAAVHDGIGCICQICGLKLNTRRLLRSHMVMHSDKKKFKCNFCFKEFKRTKEFKNHLILHTGLKPYKCPFCKLNFANGSNCRKHQKTVHPTELATQELKGKKKISKSIPTIEELNALVYQKVS
ncbi:zinc finger protein weckle-like [Condylostylus longicornis]|uniref:zinc finger protein weckle-like n=1 Tax=Condylostylus longicornis TaxID=2530218 RepID=UPI00244E1734|nr:zinc finger protein weckle-like [Condylostylus longicornis]